jgi:hypothetical protein
MNIAQAVTLSARCLEARTETLRGLAGPAAHPQACLPPDTDWPRDRNLRELRASRALIARLVTMLG